MPLIDVPERNVEDLQAEFIRTLSKMLTDNYSQMLSLHKTGFAMVWNNKDGLTPQQCFDAMGSEAVMFLSLGQVMAELLNTAVPGSVIETPPQPLTVNEDGTVTVG
jgi:hypothetical protein